VAMERILQVRSGQMTAKEAAPTLGISRQRSEGRAVGG